MALLDCIAKSILLFCLISMSLGDDSRNEVIAAPPGITDFIVRSTISARFAKVKINTRVFNDAKEGRETMFQVQFPEEAFISELKMTTGNEVRYGVVKEKKEAQDIYAKAREEGKSAGKITQRASPPGRDMDTYVINVNVASESSTEFELTYNELIEMKFGCLTQRIHVEPMQVVGNLSVRVDVWDPQGIQYFTYTLPNSTHNLVSSTAETAIVHASMNTRELQYKPSVNEQEAHDQTKGINGDLEISYSTDRENNGGIVLVKDGYFVHYFSPTGLEVIAKNIIFVIDISGSMYGLKIQKVTEVMMVILDKIRSNDYFNILVFDNEIDSWKNESMQGTLDNIHNAKVYANNTLIAYGKTNINDALYTGLNQLISTSGLVENHGNILVFLTDGKPTEGETNIEIIRKNVRTINEGQVAIYALGFGDGADMDFLSALAWENGGFARHIYAEGDADEQLESFYREIESNLLLNVKITYEPLGIVSQLTQTTFSQYRNGSEIAVVGVINHESAVNPSGFIGRVGGQAKSERVQYTVNPKPVSLKTDVDFTERLWAYMKIKDLLKEATISNSKFERDSLEERTLNLSLKYQFVTPLTSMVVTSDMLLHDNTGRSGVDYDYYDTNAFIASHDAYCCGDEGLILQNAVSFGGMANSVKVGVSLVVVVFILNILIQYVNG